MHPDTTKPGTILKPATGPWIPALKKLDPEKHGTKKHGMNMGLKNVSDFMLQRPCAMEFVG